MGPRFRWLLGGAMIVVLAAVPAIHYRCTYHHFGKRLRVVTPGRFYRSGQMTADGLRQTIARFGIRSVINLQHESPDPKLSPSLLIENPVITESELCRSMGVEYHLLTTDLIPRNRIPAERPKVIDEYLRILDDEKGDTYPVLLHCKAGLHRTGILTAIYRMEYDGWPLQSAVRELRANGFGNDAANDGNDYMIQYLKFHRPGVRNPLTAREGRP